MYICSAKPKERKYYQQRSLIMNIGQAIVMTPEERLNACNYLRRQICNEQLKIEAFRKAIKRPGFSGGNIIVTLTNGELPVFRIYPTDDMQDVL